MKRILAQKINLTNLEPIIAKELISYSQRRMLILKLLQMKDFSKSVLIFSLIIACACQNVEKSNNLIKAEFSATTNNFTDLIESIELLPLETDSDHLLGEGAELIVSDTSFYMFDIMNSKIYRYSHSGSFLNSIGQKGNGNGEYLSLNGIQVNDNILTVHSYPDKILKYTLNGEFVSQSTCKGLGQFSHSFSDNTILTYYGYGTATRYRAALLDTDGVLEKFLSDGKTDKVLNYSSSIPPISNHKSRLFLIDSFSPIVYEYSNSALVPSLHFNFGKYSVPDEYYNYSDVFVAAEYLMSRAYAIINRYVENDSLKLVEILLSKVDSCNPYYGLYYKNEWHWFSFGEGNSPMSFAFRCFYDDKTLLFLLSPDAVHNLPDSLQQFVINYDISKSIAEEDNYIIAKVFLK